MDVSEITTNRSDDSQQGNPRLAAALEHAQRGAAVFPLCTPKPGGGCVYHQTECDHPGKRPLINGRTTRATTKEATIRELWKQWPDANIGILTGGPSDLLVLDVDNRNGGAESLKRLEATYGSLPPTWTVKTGDGAHYYFRHADLGLKNGTHLAEGVEVRTTGGSVVGAGSRHASGVNYAWIVGAEPGTVELAAFPAALLQARQPSSPPAAQLSGYLTEGSRNVHLTQIAGTLRHRGVSQDALDGALRAVNDIDGDPPLPSDEVQGIARSVGRYDPGPGPSTPTSWVAARSTDRIRLLTVDQLFERPRAEWLVEGIVEARRLAMANGPSDTYKSFMTLGLGLCVATGCDWHGHAVKPGPVVFVVAEGGSGIRNRVRAWMQEQEIDTIPNAFFLLDDLQLLASGDVKALNTQIAHVCPHPALIVLDTFAACFVGGEENSAKDTGLALSSARYLVNTTGATVLLVHHSGRQDTDRERGSSALKGNVDVMISVSRTGDTIAVKNTKQKDHEAFRPFQLQLKQVELGGGETSCVLIDCRTGSPTARATSLSASEQRALDVLATFGNEGTTSAEWRNGIKTKHDVAVPDKTFQNWRQSLVRKGLVAATPGRKSTYRVTEVASANGTPNSTP